MCYVCKLCKESNGQFLLSLLPFPMTLQTLRTERTKAGSWNSKYGGATGHLVKHCNPFTLQTINGDNTNNQIESYYQKIKYVITYPLPLDRLFHELMFYYDMMCEEHEHVESSVTIREGNSSSPLWRSPFSISL